MVNEFELTVKKSWRNRTQVIYRLGAWYMAGSNPESGSNISTSNRDTR